MSTVDVPKMPRQQTNGKDQDQTASEEARLLLQKKQSEQGLLCLFFWQEENKYSNSESTSCPYPANQVSAPSNLHVNTRNFNEDL